MFDQVTAGSRGVVFYTQCIRPSIMPSFRSMLDLIVNTQFNLKDKVMLEFSIILSLMLIVSHQIGLKLGLILGFRVKFKSG